MSELPTVIEEENSNMLTICPKCGRQNVEADKRNRHLCVDCSKAENVRATHYHRHQEDWIEEAKAADIDPWARQPRETQWEYTVWCAYRDTYPGKPATYSQLAQQLGTSTSVVKAIAMRWTFSVRMQAWIAYCDKVTLAQRRQEILSMNKQQVSMAAALNNKIAAAIAQMDPTEMKPSDIASLMRTAAELERKARVDTVAQEGMLRDAGQLGDNTELKKRTTDVNDLSEIVGILAKAGALGQMKVTQTVTTSVESDNNIIDVEEA